MASCFENRAVRTPLSEVLKTKSQRSRVSTKLSICLKKPATQKTRSTIIFLEQTSKDSVNKKFTMWNVGCNVGKSRGMLRAVEKNYCGCRYVAVVVST